MSMLPRIPPNNSDGFISYPKSQSQSHSQIQIPSHSIASTSESQKSTMNDYYPPYIMNINPNNFNPLNYTSNTNNNNKLSPFAFEAKLNSFETKLNTLEHTNHTLLLRLSETEQNFSKQLLQIQRQADEERESRYKTDKTITTLSSNYTHTSSDLQTRLNILQDMIDKDEHYKLDQRNRELATYKSLINKVTEKVAAIVKIEVDARYKSDTEHKQMVNGLNTRLESEIESMRRDMDEFMTITRQELSRSFKECGERADSVSKYFDQQLASAMFGNDYNKNMNGFMMKLTEQVKANLTSQGNKNESTELRLKAIEDYLPSMKESFYQFISTIEERMVNKIRDIRLFSEINITKSNEALMHHMTQVSKYTDEGIQVLSNQLIDTRNRVNMTLNDMAQTNKAHLSAVCDDLTTIANRVYQYESILKDHQLSYDDIKLKIDTEVNSIRIHYDVQSTNERIIRAVENEEIKDTIRECVKALSSINSNFADNMTEINKSSEMNFMGLIERMNTLQDMVTKSATKTYFMFEDVQRNFDRIETKQMLNEAMFRIEDDYIIGQLEQGRVMQLKTKEQLEEMHKTFDSSGSNVMEMMKAMKEEVKEREAKESVNRTIEGILMDVDMKAKELYNRNKAEMNDVALMNALTALDNRFQDHVNNNESEFKIVKEMIEEKEREKGKDKGAAVEMEIKCTLQQVINNAEFDNLYTQINRLSRMSGNISAVQGQNQGMRPSGSEENKDKENINDVIDSKINGALERIKNENVNMWINSVELTQKINQTEEIKKIIQEVPPVIVPFNESMKRIMDLNYNFKDNPHPKVSSNTDSIDNQLQMPNDIQL